MSNIGNPDFNWSAPSLEKEFIRFKRVARNNFIAHKTTNKEQQGSFLRGWIGDIGEEKLESFNWTDDKFYNPDEILERLQQVIQPSTIGQSNKYKKDLITYRQTTETFSQFFVELKRRYDLAKDNSKYLCREHNTCKECIDRMKQEDLMSYIYIGVREQRARELIDQLATADHTLEKYKSICEGCDTTDNNAQIFNNTGAEEGGATGGNIHAFRGKGQGKNNNYNNSNYNRTKCQNCGNFHKKDACRAKDQRCNICHKLGHFSKVCQNRQQGAAQGHTQRRFIPKQKPSRLGGKQVHEIENDNLYIVDSAGNQIGITDYDSVNQAFQEVNYAVIDSIEFSLDPGTGKLKYNSKHSNVEINQVLQAKTWKEAEATILMYPSDDKGKITGRPKGMKSKLDTGAGANIMSLSTYKSINPSDFDKEGKPTGNFQRSSTGLKSFGGRQIQQYGIKTIKCAWNKKLCLLNFHIVDAEGPI